MSKNEIERNKRADVMETNLSVGVSESLRDQLSQQSSELKITKSRAANILLQYCLDNGILEKLVEEEKNKV